MDPLVYNLIVKVIKASKNYSGVAYRSLFVQAVAKIGIEKDHLVIDDLIDHLMEAFVSYGFGPRRGIKRNKNGRIKSIKIYKKFYKTRQCRPDVNAATVLNAHRCPSESSQSKNSPARLIKESKTENISKVAVEHILQTLYNISVGLVARIEALEAKVTAKVPVINRRFKR